MNEPKAGKRIAQQPLRLVVLLTLGLFPVSSLIAANKWSVDLEGLLPAAKVDVIVQFTSLPTAADLARLAQMGGTVKAQFRHIPDVVVTVPAAAVKGISADPRILYISPADRKLGGALEFAEPTVGAATAFKYGWDGSGVGVAVIDSGIVADHPDLKYRVVHAENFVSGESTTSDLYGHGTCCAALVTQ